MPAVIKHMQMRVKDPLTGEYTMVDTMRGPKGDKGDKGDPGEPGTGVSIHICSSAEYDAETRVPTVQTPEANTFYLVPAENAASPDMFVEWIFANGDWEMFGSATVEVPVQDVQVNGTSVVQDGVAEMPIATTWNKLGFFKVPDFRGLSLDANGSLGVKRALLKAEQIGNSATMVLTPSSKACVTFYGLAEAAGDTSLVYATPVGQYTDSAKSAIQTMLNGPVTVSGTTPSITALPGIQYVCGEVSTLDITLPASGCVDVVFQSGSTPTVLTVTPQTGMTVEWANGFDSTALEADTLYELNIKMVGTKCLGVAGSWT